MNLEAMIGSNFTQFLLVFVRATGLILTAPIFQNRSIPPQAKALFGFGLAILVAPFIKTSLDLNQFNTWMALATLIQEVLVGIIIGFMANLTFYAIQIAGYFIDVPMGFGVVNIIDPNSGTEMPLMGHFHYILAALIFLSINGHHSLITSFIKSFDLVAPGMFFVKKEAVGVFVQAFANMFYFGFKIGIPIMASIFLADIALGIIAKLVPQINVFVIGFPIKVAIGLFMLIIFIPTYVMIIANDFSSSGDAFRVIRMILQHLHP